MSAFFYGFFYYFSGPTLFDDQMARLYDILFTMFPIIMFGIFDNCFTDDKYLTNPIIYKTGHDNYYYNGKKLLIEIFLGAITGIDITLCSLACFDFGTYEDGK